MSDSDRPVVLIVEDEPYVAETYRLWLREDYEVEMAHDGDEGLSKLDADVDVVLLDRMMPGLSVTKSSNRSANAIWTAASRWSPRSNRTSTSWRWGSTPTSRNLSGARNPRDGGESPRPLGVRRAPAELLPLVEKRATLEATKSNAELAESEEYDELKEEIAELQDDLSDSPVVSETTQTLSLHSAG